MEFDISHEGRTTLATNYDAAIALGYPETVIGAAIKLSAKQQVTGLANVYRNRLASASAGKLAEYRIKEEIARDPTIASIEELAMLDREAAAKGIDRPTLLAIINTKAAAYRQIALLIGALEAEAGAAIDAIADDATDIETQILTVLGAANAQAETAFNEALALIKGGS